MTKTSQATSPWFRSGNRQSAIENPKWLALLIIAVVLVGAGVVAHAQPATKVFRIAYLDAGTASGRAVLVDAFRHELRQLGWTEGKNITIEYRFAEQKRERLPELVADLVRLKVDLIVISGTNAAIAAKKATITIPIVMPNAGDPRGFRVGYQLGAAGRKSHRVYEFIPRAKHEKARDTQGRGPEACPGWRSAASGSQRGTRCTNEGAWAGGSSIEAKIRGDQS
jgi:hypothetical protein